MGTTVYVIDRGVKLPVIAVGPHTAFYSKLREESDIRITADLDRAQPPAQATR